MFDLVMVILLLLLLFWIQLETEHCVMSKQFRRHFFRKRFQKSSQCKSNVISYIT